jgi:ribonuclease VapC
VIVVDTSALMAIARAEANADRLKSCLQASSLLVMSAGTLAEALVVAGHRGMRAAILEMVADLDIAIVPVTGQDAHDVAAAHHRWGRGAHPAGLNFGDCFAYALAMARGWPLLYVGDDFARTDVAPALPA